MWSLLTSNIVDKREGVRKFPLVVTYTFSRRYSPRERLHGMPRGAFRTMLSMRQMLNGMHSPRWPIIICKFGFRSNRPDDISLSAWVLVSIVKAQVAAVSHGKPSKIGSREGNGSRGCMWNGLPSAFALFQKSENCGASLYTTVSALPVCEK